MGQFNGAFHDDNNANLAAIEDYAGSNAYITQDNKIYLADGGTLERVAFEDSTDTDTLVKAQNASAFDGDFTSATIETMVSDTSTNASTMSAQTQAELTDTASKGHEQNTDTGTTSSTFAINRSSGTKRCTIDTDAQSANVTIDTEIMRQVFASELPSKTKAQVESASPTKSTVVYLSDEEKYAQWDTTSDKLFDLITGEEIT